MLPVMNLPRLLLLLLCLSSVTGSFLYSPSASAERVYYYFTNERHSNGALKTQGITCQAIFKRAQQHGRFRSGYWHGSYGSSPCSAIAPNTRTNFLYKDCPSGVFVVKGQYASCGSVGETMPDEPNSCNCQGQAECDAISKATQHSSCVDGINSGSNDHFFSNYSDSSDYSCPDYSSSCGSLDGLCGSSNAAGSLECQDYCSIPEYAQTESCLLSACFNNPSASHCSLPTPDSCSKDPNQFGCEDFCSNPTYSGYPQCSNGGIPETAGVFCATESECLAQAVAQNEKICSGATGYEWNFDHTTYKWDYSCTFDNGGQAGSDFEGDWKENTSDDINTPDRTTDNTPDDTPEADQLEVADSQVEALNNANKNLNSIESLTRDTNDGLTTISGTLDQIKAAIEAGNNSGGDSGTTDVSGVESRLDAIDDTLSSPAYDQSDWSETGADLQASVDLSQVSFNSTGFLSSGSCPAPYSVQVLSNSFTIDYQPFCDLASIIKAIVLGFAYFWAARIFMREVA